MDFLNWKNLFALLAGGILAGLLIGGFKAYENHKRETIASKLHLAEKLLTENKTAEAEKLVSEIPPPSVGYLHLRLGDFYADQNRLNKALTHFGEAAKIFQEVDKPLYYFSVERSGYILYRKGEYEKSLSLLQGLPENIPNFCEVELIKAEDYAALGEYRKLSDTLQKVLDRCSDKTTRLTAEYLINKYLKGKGELKPDRNG